MQERGLSAYLAELIGTFLLVFFITSVVVLFVATGDQAQFGSDFAVVGLVHAFLLFGLIVMFGVVSGGHFNPAVTLAAAAIKRISPMDAAIYMLAQLSGGVLGALLCKGLLLDEGRATHYGAAEVSGLLGGNFQGAIVEAIGTFCLVLVILAAVFSKKSFKEWAPLAIGTTLGFIVMVGGPLTGGSFNPARWFGPALVGNEWGGVWPYLVGPIVGSLLAAAVFRFVLEAGGPAPTEPPEPVKATAEEAGAAEEARAAEAAKQSRLPDLSLSIEPPGAQGPAAFVVPGGIDLCSSVRSVRRVTFSRNYTLSLSRTCQCYCKYCAFATHRAHIHAPEAVAAKLDEAERRNAKELLVLTGERPEVNAEVAAKLAEWGHEDFTSYVVWACERALERGILPHTNLGVLEQGGPRPPARGHGLSGPDAGVDLRAADGDRPRRARRPSIRRSAWRRSKPRAS